MKKVLLILSVVLCSSISQAGVTMFTAGSRAGFTLDTTGEMPFFLDFTGKCIRNCRYRINGREYTVWSEVMQSFTDFIMFPTINEYEGKVWLYYDKKKGRGEILLDGGEGEEGKITSKDSWIMLYKLNKGKIEGSGVIRRIDGRYKSQDFSGTDTSKGGKSVSLLIVTPECNTRNVNPRLLITGPTSKRDGVEYGGSITREGFKNIIKNNEYKGNLFLYENLYGAAATPANTIKMLKTFQRCSDLVIFIFIGHGIGGSDPYMVLKEDANGNRRLYGARLTYSLLNNPRAGGRTFCIIDCCYGGGMLTETGKGVEDAIRKQLIEGASEKSSSSPVFFLSGAQANECGIGGEDGSRFYVSFSKWYASEEMLQEYGDDTCKYSHLLSTFDNMLIITPGYKPKPTDRDYWQYDEQRDRYIQISRAVVIGNWPMNERVFH